MLRYYGFLANRVRKQQLPLVRVLLGQNPQPKLYNLKYAELMLKTLGLNPKLCILCNSPLILQYRRIGANATFFYNQHSLLALRKKIVA